MESKQQEKEKPRRVLKRTTTACKSRKIQAHARCKGDSVGSSCSQSSKSQSGGSTGSKCSDKRTSKGGSDGVSTEESGARRRPKRRYKTCEPGSHTTIRGKVNWKPSIYKAIFQPERHNTYVKKDKEEINTCDRTAVANKQVLTDPCDECSMLSETETVGKTGSQESNKEEELVEKSMNILQNINAGIDVKVHEYMDGENMVELRILKYFAESELLVGRKKPHCMNRECGNLSINQCIHTELPEDIVLDLCQESGNHIEEICQKGQALHSDVCMNLFWRKRIKKLWYYLIEFPFYLFFMLALAYGIKNQRRIGKQLLCSYTEQVLTNTKFLKPGTDISMEFKDIETTGEIWQFLRYVLKPLMYGELETLATAFSVSLQFLNQSVIGYPWMHQVKYHPVHCDCFHERYNEFFNKCIALHPESLYTKSFGEKSFESYEKYNNYLTDLYYGKFGDYENVGYSFTIHENPEEVDNDLDMLSNFWIDSTSTRVFFIDFVTYNPGTSTFFFTKIVFEHPAAGGIHKTILIYPFSEKTSRRMFLQGVEPYFVLIVIAYIIFCVVFIVKKRVVLKSFWMIYNLFFLTVSVIFIIYGFSSNVVIAGVTDDFIKQLANADRKSMIPNFYGIYLKHEHFEWYLIVLFVLATFKMLHFLGSIFSMHVLGVSIRRHWTGFFALFILLYFTLHLYTLAGLAYFQLDSKSFSTYREGLKTTWKMFFGIFNYSMLLGKYDSKGVLYVIMFTIFVKWFYEAMVIGVIVNYFADLLAGFKKCAGHPSIKNILKEIYLSGLKFIGFKNYVRRKRKCLNSNYLIIINALKRTGRSDDDINSFLKKHNISPLVPVPLRTTEYLYRRIIKEAVPCNESVRLEKIDEKLRLIKSRMNYIADNLCFILLRLKELQPVPYKRLKKIVAAHCPPTNKCSIRYIKYSWKMKRAKKKGQDGQREGQTVDRTARTDKKEGEVNYLIDYGLDNKTCDDSSSSLSF